MSLGYDKNDGYGGVIAITFLARDDMLSFFLDIMIIIFSSSFYGDTLYQLFLTVSTAGSLQNNKIAESFVKS